MTLKPKFLLILSLFQLSLGLGWIFGYLLIPPTVFFYEQAAVRALQKEYHTVRTEGLNSESDIVLQPYEFFNKGQTAPLPVVSLHRESALNSFPTYPPNPMDYTVLFRHLYEQGARNVYAIAPMAWEEEPDNIVKSAVGYELEEPQITTEAGTLGTVVENSDLFSASQESGKSFPLFVRWGEDIIPTLPLVAALNALDLDPEDVRLIPGDTLLLGNSRSIPLDEYGRIPLAENSGPTLLDTQEVIVPVMSGLRPPDMSAVRKLLSSADAVIVSEPFTPSEAPDAQALLTAKTIRSIMGALAPAPAMLIPVAPAWVQWVIVLDVLLLATWALRFRKRGRWLLWAFCILSAPVLAWYLFSVHGVWFPVMTPVTGVLCVALAGSLIPWFSPPSHEAEEDDGEDPPPSALPENGNGAGSVLPPDNLYQEPNEVPIPHHPKKQSDS